MTDPDQPSEELPAQAVALLNRSLKNCHKMVSSYRSVLLKKPSGDSEPPKDE